MSFQSTSHQLSVDVAVKYGIEEALIISNFQFWINKNYSDGINKHDDRTWTYNTTESLAKLFPYMTTRAVRYALDGLVKKGVLIKGNYNKAGYDRTAWYAFFDEKTWLYTVASDLTKTSITFDENVNSHLTKTANGFDKNVQPIPDNKPDRKQQIENTNKEKEHCAKNAQSNDAIASTPAPEKPKREIFKPPTLAEVVEFIVTEGLESFIDANDFMNYYEANGWMVAKNKMKSWRATIKIWVSREKKKHAQKSPNSATNTSQGLQYQSKNSGTNYGTNKTNQQPIRYASLADEAADGTARLLARKERERIERELQNSAINC